MHAAALAPMLAAALLLPGCAAPSPTAPRAAQLPAPAGTQGVVGEALRSLPDLPPSAPETPLWRHPCPLPPPAEHRVEPGRATWRAAGCFVAQEPVLTGLTVGQDGMDFSVPEGALRVHALFHLDGRHAVDVVLAMGRVVVARGTGEGTQGDTVVVLDVPRPAAGNYTLRAELDPERPMQGWWGTVQVDLPR